MSQKTKLSQMTAILLERARRFGVSDEVLLSSLKTNDTTPLKIAEDQHYHYDEFFTYAEKHGEDLEDTINNGYKMKFNTLGGLQIWMKECFGLEAGTDFTASPGKIENVKLSIENISRIFNTLASNWIMLDSNRKPIFGEDQSLLGDPKEIRIVHLFILSEYEAYKNE
ncbi:hypothetical protein [Cytobacillus dafuensis]|uniref:hypothetical protein n=1 Tax=Cytobacillus dafuensis TaxID=1742359 RepID=UPI00070CFC27|nr:hypothetical protein [Cytobacillus dafuensis]